MTRGTTLVEVLAALVCGLLVVQVSLAGLGKARSIELDFIERSERLATLRASRVVLRRELRFGVRGLDWVPFPPDSIRLRAFRGVGLVCANRAQVSDLLVAWSGTREPDASKDSVLLLTVNGAWIPGELLSARGTSDRCGAATGTGLARWLVSVVPPETVVLARLFEHGSYHISGSALRYRRGRAGRQPLTPEAFDTPPSGFVQSETGLALEWIRLEGGEPSRWVGPLAGAEQGRAP